MAAEGVAWAWHRFSLAIIHLVVTLLAPPYALCTPCGRASCTWRLPACCGGRFASPGGTFGAAPPFGLRSRHGAHPHRSSVTGAPAPRGAAGAIAHPFRIRWVGLCAPTLTVALPTPHMALGALLRAPPPHHQPWLPWVLLSLAATLPYHLQDHAVKLFYDSGETPGIPLLFAIWRRTETPGIPCHRPPA